MHPPTFKKLKLLLILSSLIQPLANAAEDKDIFVDPLSGQLKGAPGVDGSITHPFKRVNDALDYAETKYNRGEDRSPYTIQLREGRYTETVTRSGIKGSPARPITVQAYQNEKVVFDGSIDLTGGWNDEGGNIYSKHIGEDVWQLFVEEGDKWQEKNNARWPNARFGNAKDGIASIYTRNSWAHANTSGNALGLMVDDTLATDPGLKDINLTGALVVANVGSFDTWTRTIRNHTENGDRFEYDPSKRLWKKQNHFYYYVEGLIELLDNDNEWFFDKETKTAYLYSSTGVPTQTIRAKKQPYAFDIGGWEHATIRNIDVFAETLRCGSCESFTLENTNFAYGGSSRRALGQAGTKSEILFIASNNLTPTHDSKNVVRNITMRNVDGQGLLMRGNKTLVENSLFENIDWAATETYAPSSSLVFHGNYSTFRQNTVKTAGTSETIATTYAPAKGTGKYTGVDGGVITVEYNDISETGFAQSDGALIQLRIPGQRGSIIRYNWLHDSSKYGIRFDAPIPARIYGSDTLAHHNVIWNANGMMVKGEDHRVYHNTVFDTVETKRSDLIILDDANIRGVLGGANKGSKVTNNAGDVISSQRAEAADILDVVEYGYNFNASEIGTLVSKQLRDPKTRDFRPTTYSALQTGDGITDPDLTADHGGVLTYSGSYRSGVNDYWYPGRREAKTTGAIPSSASENIALTADLIWRPAYQASSYLVYLGKNEANLSLVSTLNNNIFDPGTLQPNQNYYWRVDAVTPSGTVSGDLWQFKTAGLQGDWDEDGDIDNDDIRGLMSALRARLPVSTAFDINGDTTVNSLDVRALVNLCTRNRCAL